jgi:hypothetical protein
MLYSKNGSIPKPKTDGTDGWVEVPEAPAAGEGQEVVWWCPPGWVVRPIKPVKEGFDYSWSQSEEQWVEYELVNIDTNITLTGSDSVFFSATAMTSDSITLSSAEPTISLDLGTGSDTVTGSATPTI